MVFQLQVEAADRIDQESRPYRAYGACRELFFRRDHEVVLEGAADTGKSRACLEKVHACLTKYPGARAAFVRKTRKSLTSTAMVTFEKQVAPEGAVKLWQGEEYRYPNGSKIHLFGLDDPERLKSAELDLIYVQEVSELERGEWELLTTRATGRGGTMPYQQLIADLNPREPGWWLYEREAAGKTTFLQVHHSDNPTITPERLAPLEALTGFMRDRLLLGLRVAAEGMYFTEFDPRLHVVSAFDPPPDWPKWCAVDYGYAAPCAVLWLAREPETRKIFVYREVYATGLRDEQQAQLIRERSEGERTQQYVLDPSMFNLRSEQGRPSIAQVYASSGLGPIYPGFNNRKQGWSVVRRVLAHDDSPPRLQIMRERCPNLIREIAAAVVDPLDPEDVADKLGSQKTSDHAIDAVRYALAVEAQPTRPAEPTMLSFG
jgi:phage terminase large subunit